MDATIASLDIKIRQTDLIDEFLQLQVFVLFCCKKKKDEKKIKNERLKLLHRFLIKRSNGGEVK